METTVTVTWMRGKTRSKKRSNRRLGKAKRREAKPRKEIRGKAQSSQEMRGEAKRPRP
mgnify:CR=1 FL=1